MAVVLAGLAAWAGSRAAVAADWPQWQGPTGTPISRERGLLQEWPKGGPPLAWKVKGLGAGQALPPSPAGRIFGMSHRGADEVVWAVSEKDGSPLWVTRLGPTFQQDKMPQASEGPGSTPTVDGERLYVVGLGGAASLPAGPRTGRSSGNAA